MAQVIAESPFVVEVATYCFDRLKHSQTDPVAKTGYALGLGCLHRYVGGMGAKEKNFHNQKMIRRGFPEAAARIQELFLAGRKKEAEEAVPDEYIDDGCLVGPPERLRERLKRWTDCGLYGLRLNSLTPESIEVFANVDKG